MKTVHENSMVAHLWANQSQSEARSHNGNFWFDGDTIYSYRTPVARMVDGANGKIALITCESYSITTQGKHLNPIHRATRGGFTVPFLDTYGARGRSHSYALASMADVHQGNLDWFRSEHAAAIAKAKRMRSDNVGSYVLRNGSEAIRYAEAFGLPVPAYDLERDESEIRAHHAARQAKRETPAYLAKRERDNAAREAREARKLELERADFETRLQAWRNGENIWLRAYNHNALNGDGAYLRALKVERDASGAIVSGTLETSQRAMVPLVDALKAFAIVRHVVANGETWRRNGHSLPVGQFQVDSISADGTMRAGCHTIHLAEMQALAAQLGI